MRKKIRYGMVGGGEGAFIGAVHRAAAALDGQLELVCGAFSSDAGKSRRSGEALFLDPGRCYGDYETMFRDEAARAEDERMAFVVIVTPNHLHYPIAVAALDNGFHVLSDKPATVSVAEAVSLKDKLENTGLLYGLTHTYTSYPMIVEARKRVEAGELGKVRKVLVEYIQGWLAEPLEHSDNAQAGWRLDPERAGISSCMADIGVHAFNLAETVTGIDVTDLCAVLHRTVEGRRLDDDGAAFLRFDNGAHGVLSASQIAVGDENNISLRVYGDKAGLEWNQLDPNTLLIKPAKGPIEVLRTGREYTSRASMSQTRTPPGHPEGYIEAFANIYRNFAEHVRQYAPGEGMRLTTTVPGIRDAIRGMAFIETTVASSEAGGVWKRFPVSA